MDLDELNKQMQFFQNDFALQQKPQQQMQQQMQNINAINFNNSNPGEMPFNTTQIKRPTKSGEHRSDINDKLNNLNMFQPMVNDVYSGGKVPNMMPLHSRSNSNYEPQYQENNIMNDIISQQDNFNNQQSNNVANTHNTHNSGLSFVNVRNMIATQNMQQQPQINTAGYNKIEEKRMDFRQNMNNKIDNFIFDNPNAIHINPILLQAQNHVNQSSGNSRDTRMVIQDSNKDYYRQEANTRMSQYSPLSRASNIPIAMANMSVNDFYANMNPQIHSTIASHGTGFSPLEQQDDKRAIMNSRINGYAPLAKTIQYQTQQNQTTTVPNWNDINNQMQGQNQILNQNIYTNLLPVMSNK